MPNITNLNIGITLSEAEFTEVNPIVDPAKNENSPYLIKFEVIMNFDFLP